MIPIADVRQRVKARIAAASKAAAGRRAAASAPGRTFDQFLEQIAVPMFRMVALSLTAEGFPFAIATPLGRVQLEAARGTNTIGLELDTSVDPPVVLGRTTLTRGHRTDSVERPLRPDLPLVQITDLDVLEFLLAELSPFLER
jgi:hypothetical protein